MVGLENFLLASLPLIVLGSLFLFIVISDYHRRTVDFLTVFDLYFVFAYIIAPLHVIYGGELFVSSRHLNAYRMFEMGTPLSIIAIVVFYLLLRKTFVSVRFDIDESPDRIPQDVVLSLIGLLFVLSIIGTIVYARLPEESDIVFVQHLVRFGWAAFLLAFPIAIFYRSKRMTMLFVVLAGWFLFTFLVLGDRLRIVMLIMVCYLTVAAWKQRIYLRYLIATGLAIPIFLYVAAGEIGRNGVDSLLSEVASLYVFVIQEFTHVYTAIEVGIQHPESPTNRAGIDLILGPLHLLPQRVLGIELPGTVAHWNTYFVFREFDTIAMPGIVGFAWQNAAWLGIIVIPIAYALFGRFVQDAILSFRRDPVSLLLLYSGAFLWGFSFARSGDPRVFFRGHVEWVLIFVLVLGVGLVRMRVSQLDNAGGT